MLEDLVATSDLFCLVTFSHRRNSNQALLAKSMGPFSIVDVAWVNDWLMKLPLRTLPSSARKSSLPRFLNSC
jgi:hypothetical protein